MSTALLFAPDTLIRFKNGRILVHTTSSSMPAFESDHPMLIGWLCQFAKPTEPNDAVGRLQAADRPGATQVLEYLQRSGAIVAADSPQAASAAADADADDSAQR